MCARPEVQPPGPERKEPFEAGDGSVRVKGKAESKGSGFHCLSCPLLLVLSSPFPRKLTWTEPNNQKGLFRGVLHKDDEGMLPDMGPAGA